VTDLFHRVASVTVGTLKVTGLRVQFKVTKTLRPEPNTAEICLTNLSADSRKQMQTENVAVVLEAGYQGQDGRSTVQQLFLGDMRVGGHSRQGTDWVTKLHAGDGEKATRTARISESFAKGARKSSVVRRLLDSMKIDVKDAVAKVGSAGFAAGAEQFAKGVSVEGSTAKELTKILGSAGYSWSIQDGKVEILGAAETIGSAIYLSPSTGLVGSPEVDSSKGYVKVVSLLQPELRPGAAVELESETFKGRYRVEKVEFRGDTHGAEWFSEAELVPV
jgi:hypothetical protein